ncbi:MAG: hypothetical protein C4320_09325, partial [Armatimonadota bacterium]
MVFRRDNGFGLTVRNTLECVTTNDVQGARLVVPSKVPNVARRCSRDIRPRETPIRTLDDLAVVLIRFLDSEEKTLPRGDHAITSTHRLPVFPPVGRAEIVDKGHLRVHRFNKGGIGAREFLEIVRPCGSDISGE